MRIDIETFRDIAIELMHLSDDWLAACQAMERIAVDGSDAVPQSRIIQLADGMLHVTQRIDRLAALLRAVDEAQETAAAPLVQ
jgi:hypothetical protein